MQGLMNSGRLWAAVCLFSALRVDAHDPAVSLEQGTVGSFSHSLYYGYERRDIDFDSRGEIRSESDGVGAGVQFVPLERWSVRIHGGSNIGPELKSAQSTWRGRAGYWYGLGVDHYVFPTTSYWPGVVVGADVENQMSFFDRLETGGQTSSVDQKLRDLRYGGSAVASWKIGALRPYLGPRVEWSDSKWTNMRPSAGAPAVIKGDIADHVGIIAGLEWLISNRFRAQFESRTVNQTMFKAQLQWVN